MNMLLNGDYQPSPYSFTASREPHLGLVNIWGVELDHEVCKGYHRINLGTTLWKIEVRDFKVHFVNVRAMSFGQAKSDWGEVYGVRVYAGSLKGDPPVSDTVGMDMGDKTLLESSVYFEAGEINFYLKDITE